VCVCVCVCVRRTTTQQPWCLAVHQLLPDLQLQNWTLHTWTDSSMTRSDPSFRRCSPRCVCVCVWYIVMGCRTTQTVCRRGQVKCAMSIDHVVSRGASGDAVTSSAAAPPRGREMNIWAHYRVTAHVRRELARNSQLVKRKRKLHPDATDRPVWTSQRRADRAKFRSAASRRFRYRPAGGFVSAKRLPVPSIVPVENCKTSALFISRRKPQEAENWQRDKETIKCRHLAIPYRINTESKLFDNLITF